MRAKTLILIGALCFTLIVSATALPQSTENRARGVSSAQDIKVHSVAYNPNNLPSSTAAGTASLESSVHREGLQFYFEIRNGGLAELARAAAAYGPVTKLMSSGPMKVSTTDMMGFMARHLGALAGARIALASYGANGMAALIEAGSDSDAQQLGSGIAQLLGADKGAGRAGARAGEMNVNVRDRLVIAGSRAIVSMLRDADGAATIVHDQEMMKARARFSNAPFFAYMDLASMPLELPGSGDSAGAAYTAGALAALNNRPYALALGGSLDGDSVTLSALLLYNTNQSEGSLAGMFSAISSSTSTGQPVAAKFAPADADLFVDVMFDWEKLYEAIDSIFGMIAGAQSKELSQSGGAQSANIFGMLEASLGFSIKYDLLPTLGNEIAISISGFDRFLGPASRLASNGQRAPAQAMPRFMLIVALKKPAEFEKLIGRIIKTGGAATQLARMPYRGQTISYSKDVAYTISGGFFIISGSPADIRRGLDAHAQGDSLASNAEFRAAVGSSQQAMLQAYMSADVTNLLYKNILTEATRNNSRLKDFMSARMHMRSAIGMTMMPDNDGLMMEMRVPTDMTVMMLAALATEKPERHGLTSAPASGIGIPSPTTPAARTRNADGRRVPKMTNDDMTGRRP